MKQIHHTKNEQGIIEFTNSFENKHLYLEKLDAEVLFELSMRVNNNTVFIPSPCTISGTTLHYIRECWQGNCPDSSFVFLDDITPNLSKYIPTDNAVLFLRADCCEKYIKLGNHHHIGLYANDGLDEVTLEGSVDAINEFAKNPIKKVTIFLPHGTQSELQKVNKVAKELKERTVVEEVNLFALHCFIPFDTTKKWRIGEPVDFEEFCLQDKIYPANKMINFMNKIITTNSTGILPVQDTELQNTERLQVIDCKEIFGQYLKENN